MKRSPGGQSDDGPAARTRNRSPKRVKQETSNEELTVEQVELPLSATRRDAVRDAQSVAIVSKNLEKALGNGSGTTKKSKKRKGKRAVIIDRRAQTQAPAALARKPVVETVKDEPLTNAFQQIFNKFQFVEKVPEPEAVVEAPVVQKPAQHEHESEMSMSEVGDNDEDDSESEGEQRQRKSIRKLIKESRMSVAQLKALTRHPEVVEWYDVSAQDPQFLVKLKSMRNTVPVPDHWHLKRKYLSGKRVLDKPPFELPAYIRDTGITAMRDSLLQQDAGKKLAARMRDKVRPKLGKVAMNYQVLHDAFFRHQTKPQMFRYGELYHEGKEYESKVKERRPGILSDELKQALGITHALQATPWLLNMQRYGPPPAYPNLRIAGLNAPLPAGAQWGYQPGAWGKPPVDEYNRPLYGDVFGQQQVVEEKSHEEQMRQLYSVPVVREPWGEIRELDYTLVDAEQVEDGDAADGEGEEHQGDKKQQMTGLPEIIFKD